VIRQFADHPVARHRAAPPENVVTAEQAADLVRTYFRDRESSLHVSSGEEYRDVPIYGLRIPVPLEEMWFVTASIFPPYVLDGGSSLIGISKRTGEILFGTTIHEGG